MKMFKNWRSDDGSIDFVQVVVGLIIVGIAAIGTIDGFHQGYGWLDYQNRHTKAVSIARSYMEYLQGRIHTDFQPTRFEDVRMLQGNQRAPLEVLLDSRDPSDFNDNVMCKVYHGPLLPVDRPETGAGIDYWRIRVWVEWNEPKTNSPVLHNQIFFEGMMLPEGL